MTVAALSLVMLVAAAPVAREQVPPPRTTVAGDLDLARLAPLARQGTIELSEVTIEGHVVASGPVVHPVRFRGGTIERGIRFTGGRLAGLTLEGTRVEGVASFDGTVFTGPLRVNGVEFRSGVSFNEAHFQGPVEFWDSRFVKTAKASVADVSFNDAVFDQPARFDDTQSQRELRFDSVLFGGDVSFLKLNVGPGASFRGTHFRKDAEFRFCKLGAANFGDYYLMTAFHGMADFRGCTLGTARFDYTEFLGDVSFVNVKVDKGDLSFRNASLRGTTTDLARLQVTAGALLLDQAHFNKLLFRWQDISRAVLAAGPSSDTLAWLHTHLQASAGRTQALDLAYHLAESRVREELARPDLGGLEWLVPRAEVMLWGLPTGHGTKLGRITVFTLSIFLGVFAILWLLARRRVLRFGYAASVTDADGKPRTTPVYERLAASTGNGPPAASARVDVWKVLGYTASLMFRLPGTDLRPIAAAWVGRCLLAVRTVGLALLALNAATLANVSPVIQALVGKIVP